MFIHPMPQEIYTVLITSRRWRHFAAMALIGDGVTAMLYPGMGAKTWKVGPRPWKNFMQGLHDRPLLTRAIGVAEIAGGVWWALCQRDGG
jgi:hypothetical protein